MLFSEYKPNDENYWRSVILFGRNVASYKFALAKALLELAENQKDSMVLEEMAIPYAKHLCEHLKSSDKQVTSASSIFLDSCRRYNQKEISEDELRDITVKKGFNNVLDAFHIVNQNEIPVRFFDIERGKVRKIHLTDRLYNLTQQFQYENLPHEIEARWRLVETAWALEINPHLLRIGHDEQKEMIFFSNQEGKRIAITSSRNALNGYQKGKCFYCFSDISVQSGSRQLADVDHFFPHALLQRQLTVNLDGVWNLVLACKNCNRGPSGKMAKIPRIKYLERLNRRNEFLIQSHHPLRETLLMQTGMNETARRIFLQQQYNFALESLIHKWEPEYESEEVF